MSEEKDQQRKVQRLRTLNGGRVMFNNRQSAYDCVIRDMSEEGCKIRFSQPTPLPPEIELFITKTGQLRPAQVRWNKKDEAGLVFTGPAYRRSL